jgi:hypothetical protein
VEILAMTQQLTTKEMAELTGAKLASKQAETLKKNRVPYLVNAYGRPVTTWDAVNNALFSTEKNAIPDYQVRFKGQ